MTARSTELAQQRMQRFQLPAENSPLAATVGVARRRLFASLVRGPVDFSHSRQRRIACRCCARLSGVQPFAMARPQ